MRTRLIRPATRVLALAVLLTGCTVGSAETIDRAGGVPSPEPVSLSVLTAYPHNELDAFRAALDRSSNGLVTLQLQRPAGDQLPPDEAIVAAVRSGEQPFAVVASRSLTAPDYPAFDALTAPLAIDSLGLQQAVLSDTGLMTTMLAQLEPHGLVGLGIIPGPLRYPVGITRDLRTPADWAGTRVAFSESRVTRLALQTLGAAPEGSPFWGDDLTGFDGLEAQLEAVVGDAYHEVADSVTVDLPLWPRPLVVLANPAALAALSDDQQRWLGAAAADALKDHIIGARDGEREAVGTLCRAGTRLVRSGSDGRAAMREALAPVVAELRRDPTTAAALDRIDTLRSELPPLSEPACPVDEGRRPTRVSNRLDGTYTADNTPDDLRAQGIPESGIRGNWGHWVLVVRNGRFAFSQQADNFCAWGWGDWLMSDDLVRWAFEGGGANLTGMPANKRGEDFLFHWTEYQGVLSLSAVDPPGMYGLAWTRTGPPDPTGFTTSCSPPAKALAEL